MPNASRKVKNKETNDKKKGVQMAMKFRNHQDPLYYDPEANDKIFVPLIDETQMTDEQKELLKTFPKKDRGMFGEQLSGDEDEKDGDDAPDLVPVEDDFVEAAALKAKLKQKAMKERRKAR